jgi:hypothetical protein
MEPKDPDEKAYLMFHYALGLPHCFASSTISYLLKGWKNFSPAAQSTMKLKLQSLIEKDDLFKLEQDVVQSFTTERRRDDGPLGTRQAAGAWRGFYDAICTYQAPPET